MIALMTPMSGFVYDGKTSITLSNLRHYFMGNKVDHDVVVNPAGIPIHGNALDRVVQQIMTGT